MHQREAVLHQSLSLWANRLVGSTLNLGWPTTTGH